MTSSKTYISNGQEPPRSQIGATLEALAATIAARRDAGAESYTSRLLHDDASQLLGKITEEAAEVVEAAQVGEPDHLRYECGDLVYHLLVVLERYGIPIDEFAAELNTRMTDEERPEGGVMLHPEHVNRGK